MEIDKETKKSVQARLNILLKDIVNLLIFVNYYKILLQKHLKTQSKILEFAVCMSD